MNTTKKFKVNVWSDQWPTVAAFAKWNDPINKTYAAKGLILAGTVEIEPVGVIWGTQDDVAREALERVRTEVNEGRMTPMGS